MTTPSTLSLVLRRARAFPAPVVSVAVNVLVVCTLVSGLAASLGLLQQDALGTALAGAEPESTVVSVTSPYADEDPARQDQLLRDALSPVVDVAGGTVVTLAGSGSYGLPGEQTGATWTFASVSGDEGSLRFADGRAPGSGPGPLEVAAPAALDLAIGDRLSLTNRSDGRQVDAVVVGTWQVPRDSRRQLADLDPRALVVSPDAFGAVAGTGTLVRWRAVPDLDRLRPDQLDEMVAAVATAQTEAAAAGEEIGGSLQTDTGLPATMGDRARELTVLRALLLVPAGLLLLVAGAGLVLVAAGLADVRREEESLLRSRGAGYRQLAGPTAVETLLLCGMAAAVAPLLAATLVRIGEVRPPLDLSAWLASAAAAAACGVALTVPVVVRALTGDRGQQLNVEKQRRRALTALVATVLLVVALGGLAVVELRGFGDTVAATTVATAGVDPLLVASPALLLLAIAVVASVLLLPLWFRLVAAGLGARGVAPALGSRFAARAVGSAVPLALAVALASGTIAFAAVERTSSEQARETRASYVAGADIRVTTPPDALRAGVAAEQDLLESVSGVTDATAVHRADTFVDDLPAQVLMTRLSPDVADDLLGAGAPAWERTVQRPWRDDSVGVPLPAGTERLAVEVGRGSGQVVLWLAAPDGEVRVLPAHSRAGATTLELPTTLADGWRLVAIRTTLDFLPDEAGTPDATVRADGEPLSTTASWWNPGRLVFVTFGTEATLPAALPVIVTEGLAADASLAVGDTLTFPVLGIPIPVEVVATVPHLRTVADGNGGVLLDADTALPSLLAAGFGDAPGEWWLDVRAGREAEVAGVLADHPEVAAGVVTREEVLGQLDDDPSTGGAALGAVLVLTGIGCLLVGGLLLFSVVLLRRRERAEQARMLTAAGADRRHLVGVLGWEHSLVAGSGLLAGVVAGTLVAATTLVSMTLGPDGQLLLPEPDLVLPWGWLLAPVAMVVVPLLAMAGLAWRDHGRALETSGPGRSRP